MTYLSKDNEYTWYTPFSKKFIEKDYLLPGQTLDERVTIICDRAEQILKIEGFAEKFKSYIKKGWYSLSSPIWSNFGTDRGLPISCFGSYLGDDMNSIMYTLAEVGIMTKHGGGTSGYFGALRGRGSVIKNNGFSSGAVHFMQPYDNIIDTISQGSTRRGNFAAYLPSDHPDILEFLDIQSEGNPIQRLSFGVTVSDQWMNDMLNGDYEKREVWAKILTTRRDIGYPYILFTDNANNNTVNVYKDKGLKIKASNLCTEIMLPSNEDESFVCDLSSMNILHYYDWKDTDAVETLTFFLDAVMTEFIQKLYQMKVRLYNESVDQGVEPLPFFMQRALTFAERHRAIGIGWLGWHSFLQSQMIAWESMEAKMLNVQVAINIKKASIAASEKLAELYGEPEMLKGYGMRNSTVNAIAPTKSSAFILGQVSEGIEPYTANFYIKDLAKISHEVKNPYLEKLLIEKGRNTMDVWDSILKKGGSVLHLDFLTEHEKNVFKKFSEISQKEILIQAAQRQKHIDQGQSINLSVHPDTDAADFHQLHVFAWEQGIKSLYYNIGKNASQEFARDILECVSCSA